MTYTEIKEKLNKCELALLQLQNKPFAQQKLSNIQQKKRKLLTLKESLQNKLNMLKEEQGVVSTDDPNDAEDLAKKGINVKLTNEEEGGVEFSKQQTKQIAREVGRALIDALREAGDELDNVKAHSIEPNSFEIFVKYKNNFEDDFSFYISQDTLHLVDFSFDKEIGEIGIKPSGQAIVHTEIIKNELLKHFKSLNEQESKRGKYLQLLDMFKAAPEEKKREIKPKLEKAAKQLGMDLDLTGITGSRKSKKRFGRMSEDLDIGHQDDEPGMLKRYAYETAVYAAKLYKLLNKYDQIEGEVDFPNWWQEKVMRARQDISKAQHYLEFEQKQPVIDQLAIEKNINEESIDYNFSEDEIKKILKLLKSGASTEIEMIKAFEKALGRKLSDDEIRGYPVDPGKVAKTTMENKLVKEIKSFEESGLMVKGRTREDNQKIDDIIEDLGLYAEWNAREGYFFLPEEEDLFDGLEKTIQKEFDKKDVNAYFEGVFENVIREEFKPNIAPGSTYAIQVEDIGNKVSLKQDNGQQVVIDKESVNDVIKVLNNL